MWAAIREFYCIGIGIFGVPWLMTRDPAETMTEGFIWLAVGVTAWFFAALGAKSYLEMAQKADRDREEAARRRP